MQPSQSDSTVSQSADQSVVMSTDQSVVMSTDQSVVMSTDQSDTNVSNTNILDRSILDTEFKIYNYLTTEYETGTIIAHTDLAPIFDENKLFQMDSMQCKVIRLRDLLEKGYISVGSVDLMDSLEIIYPDKRINQPVKPPTVRGLYMHGSRRQLIGGCTKIDFEYDPPSDCDDHLDNQPVNGALDWLAD
jgi:hypothetical protein